MELCYLTALELREKLENREISSREVVSALLARIEKLDKKVRAFLSLEPETALLAAERADTLRKAKGENPPLLGIPLAIKDNICVKGFPCTCASRILAGFNPPYDATVIERIKAAGGIILGKTNLDEFAMGSSTENSGYFPTRNPWDTERVPGGSSGGSAAAVSAGMAYLSLGSDTGGSIRQPAAFCGISCLKPTYGVVSRYGLVAFASSLDQIGPLARSVKDLALILNVIGGYDPKDSTSLAAEKPDYLKELSPAVKELTLGVAREFLSQGLDAGVREKLEAAFEIFKQLGIKIKEISLPHLEYALPAYYIIAPAEASSNLARYDGARYGYRKAETSDILSMFKLSRKEGFGAEVKRRIMIGTYALSSGYFEAYYLKAQKVRTLIKQDFAEAFKQCQLILSPTTPSPAFKLGEKSAHPLAMYLSDIYTIAVNLAGLPAGVIPCGFSKGLPVGLQLIGPPLSESLILNIAQQFQAVTDFHLQNPVIQEV